MSATPDIVIAPDARGAHSLHRLVGPSRYWLTPPDLYAELDAEFRFDFDPCPCPLPDGYNGLQVPWGRRNYVNPPFRAKDGITGGPTAFARKAIEEQKHGNTSVLLIPVQSYVNLLLEAGAELRSAGRVRWLEAETKEPMRNPSQILCAILRPNVKTQRRRATELQMQTERATRRPLKWP